MIRSWVGVALALAGLAGGALAEGGGADDRSFNIRPSITNDDRGGHYVVRGNAPGFPDGTGLHLTLTIAGSGASRVKVYFFKVTVQNGAFVGGRDWPNQPFAPLIYRTTVELFVAQQPPAVKQVLMREFGYPAQHREVLADEDFAVGTGDERTNYSRTSLLRIRESLRKADGLRNDGVALMQQPRDEAWEKACSQYLDKLQAYQRDLRAFENEVVVRREQEFFGRLRSLISEMFNSIGYFKDGNSMGLDTMSGSLGEYVRRVEVDIESRLPITPTTEMGGGEPQGN